MGQVIKCNNRKRTGRPAGNLSSDKGSGKLGNIVRPFLGGRDGLYRLKKMLSLIQSHHIAGGRKDLLIGILADAYAGILSPTENKRETASESRAESHFLREIVADAKMLGSRKM